MRKTEKSIAVDMDTWKILNMMKIHLEYSSVQEVIDELLNKQLDSKLKEIYDKMKTEEKKDEIENN